MNSECKHLGAAVLTVALFIPTTALSLAESEAIPLDQLGAVATKQVEGEGLSVTASENGARLRCAFQRLGGQATPEGLWLTSTTDGPKPERFRLVAVKAGRSVFCPPRMKWHTPRRARSARPTLLSRGPAPQRRKFKLASPGLAS